MSSFKLLGAAAILFAATVARSRAAGHLRARLLRVFYPNANCQNKGPGNPYTDPNAQRSMTPGSQTVGVATVKRPQEAGNPRAVRRIASDESNEAIRPATKAGSPRIAITSAMC